MKHENRKNPWGDFSAIMSHFLDESLYNIHIVLFVRTHNAISYLITMTVDLDVI